jgi:hypothetical protein
MLHLGFKLFGPILTALAIAATAGCVTADEVRSIVTEANAAAVAADAAVLDADPSPVPGEGWRDSVARIEAFIAENPDEAVTNNALRVREAVILLGAGQANLARAVLEEVDPGRLGSARDSAIYAAREHLVWWYGLGSVLTGSDFERGEEALVGIAAVADGLDRADYTRRFFEEMRVRIALRLARSRVQEEDIRSLLDDGARRYAAQWDQDDQRAIQVWHGSAALADSADLRTLRWYDFVPVAFATADDIVREVCTADCPAYTPTWVACIERGTC